MEYISADETAKKWGIGKRQVQALLANGRIPSAIRYGRIWLIPKDENKPEDLRKRNDSEETIKSANTSVKDTQTSSPEIETNLYEECGLDYFYGDFEKVKQYYKSANTDEEKFGISSMAICAAISTNDHTLFLEIESFLKEILNNTKEERIKKLAQMCLATAYIASCAPRMAPEWLKDGDFSLLSQLDGELIRKASCRI